MIRVRRTSVLIHVSLACSSTLQPPPLDPHPHFVNWLIAEVMLCHRACRCSQNRWDQIVRTRYIAQAWGEDMANWTIGIPGMAL
ncbi:hypothetical protein C8Q79DRAFT_517076 [Trametes meyenii]|nr:hypothetical protein C8Q79DRAFT_517076 [Trametes meyenii]